MFRAKPKNSDQSNAVSHVRHLTKTKMSISNERPSTISSSVITGHILSKDTVLIWSSEGKYTTLYVFTMVLTCIPYYK